MESTKNKMTKFRQNNQAVKNCGNFRCNFSFNAFEANVQHKQKPGS